MDQEGKKRGGRDNEERLVEHTPLLQLCKNNLVNPRSPNEGDECEKTINLLLRFNVTVPLKFSFGSYLDE